jgi:hypothetical protein
MRQQKPHREAIDLPMRDMETLLALPFTLLRQVDIGDVMPPLKSNVIRLLGYGTNAKLMVRTQTRLWRDQGLDGDFPFQTGWDGNQLRTDSSSVFTFFLGGRPRTSKINENPVMSNSTLFFQE